MSADDAALVGLDWGTSSLRAFLFDAGGSVLEWRRQPHGIRALPAGGFDAALAGITRDWPRLPRLACGMVGARGGWHEMPYLDTPVDAHAVASALGQVMAADGAPVHLVPGLRQPARPDVLRGEETQVLGALALAPAGRSTFVLPGTHSKWVSVDDGHVDDFRTAMTGELHALLLAHSILGAGVPADAPGSEDAFDDGVRAARDSGAAGAMTRIFRARASLLCGALAAADVPSWLSGLLVGEEIRGVVAEGAFALAPGPVLVGDATQCARYRRALAAFDIDAHDECQDAAAAGLWAIARGAGLVATTEQPRVAGSASA